MGLRELEDDRVASIYATQVDRVVALGCLLTGNPAEAEDLAQEIFAGIVRRSRNEPGFLHEPAWPWLRLAMVRLAMRRRRQLAAELRRIMRTYQPPGDGPWAGESLDYVAAISRLPARMRACVVLFYQEGPRQSDDQVVMFVHVDHDLDDALDAALPDGIPPLRRKHHRRGGEGARDVDTDGAEDDAPDRALRLHDASRLDGHDLVHEYDQVKTDLCRSISGPTPIAPPPTPGASCLRPPRHPRGGQHRPSPLDQQLIPATWRKGRTRLGLMPNVDALVLTPTAEGPPGGVDEPAWCGDSPSPCVATA